MPRSSGLGQEIDEVQGPYPGGGAVLANFLAVIEVLDTKFLSGRAPVEGVRV